LLVILLTISDHYHTDQYDFHQLLVLMNDQIEQLEKPQLKKKKIKLECNTMYKREKKTIIDRKQVCLVVCNFEKLINNN